MASNILKILRSLSTGVRPSGQTYGVPYVNFGDNQFGVFDSGNLARDLIGVPYFSASKTYSAGNPVVQSGSLYVANGAISAGAFNAAQWTLVTGAQQKRNYIINGGMMVSELNGQVAGTQSGYYVADQFYVGFTLSVGAISTVNVVQSSSISGSPNRIRCQCTTINASPAAGDQLGFTHKIEGLRTADLQWGTASAKTIIIQFTCRSSVAGTYPLAVRNATGTRSYVGQYTIAAGEVNTEVVKSVVIPGDVTGSWPTDTGTSFLLNWMLMCGSTLQGTPNVWSSANVVGFSGNANLMTVANNFFDLMDVGLYQGTTAPPFQVPEYDVELAHCQRYWEKSYNRGTNPAGTGALTGAESVMAGGLTGSSAQLGKSVHYGVRKRVIPTITLYSAQTGSIGKLYDTIAAADITGTADSVSDFQFRAFGTASVSGGVAGIYWHWIADARLP
jgi:hypothetical protein